MRVDRLPSPGARRPLALATALLGACAPALQSTTRASGPAPDEVVVVDLRSRATISLAELGDSLRQSDVVLLGELHDSAVHHRVRAGLLSGAGRGRVAAVFEHFPRGAASLPRPVPGEPLTTWLDATGFDRAGWRWPLHAPLIEAALADARTLRGSGVSHQALRGVVKQGSEAAPPELRALVEKAPMDEAALALLDADLVEGHCGKLPAPMLPGMRAAQQVRDAAMAQALLEARADGQPWLLAGNGHVRRDLGVARLLRALAPQVRVLSVGFIERTPAGALPELPAASAHDMVVITASTDRPDPCAGLEMPSGSP